MKKGSGKKVKEEEEACDDWENEDYDDTDLNLERPNDEEFKHLNLNKVSDDKNFYDEESGSSTGRSKFELESAKNSEIWNEANKKPKYIIVPTTSTSSHSSTSSSRPIPQEAIFGSSNLKILKRPKKEDSSTIDKSTFSSSNSTKNLCDLSSREKSYQEARERIFGSNNSDKTNNNNDDDESKKDGSSGYYSSKILKFSNNNNKISSNSSSVSNNVQIERQPKGPNQFNQKGFSKRNVQNS